MSPPSEPPPDDSGAAGHGPGAPPTAVPPPPPGLDEPRRPAPEGVGGRLHPAAIALWPLSQIGPLIFLFVAGRLEPAVGVLVFGGLVLTSLVRWLRFTWHVDRSALIVEQGLLERRRRVIPRDRIQSVDLVRKLRHRLFGVVELRVEAVGGTQTEGRLDALGPIVARQLRALLLDDASPGGADRRDALPGRVLARVPPGRLVVAGLTGGRVGVVAALLGFGQELVGPDFVGDRLDDLVDTPPGSLGLRGVAVVVAALLVVAFVLSIVATIVTYWDFTLTVDGPRLRIRRGLLEQRLETVPLRRLQALRIEENLVRRLLGLAAVKIDVAGRSGGEDAKHTGFLLPLGRRDEAVALVSRVLAAAGHSEAGDAPLAPMPRRALTRRLARAVVPVAVVAAAAVWWQGPAGAWSLLLAAPALALAVAAYRALGAGRRGDTVLARNGVLVRRTAYVPVARMQSLALTANPLQRQRRLATVELQVARSPGVWPGPRLVDLDEGDGARWLSELAVEVATAPAPVTAGGGSESAG